MIALLFLLLCATTFIILNRLLNRQKTAHFRLYSRYIGTAILLIIGFWAYCGVRWNPKFDINALRGLTPNQVVSQLGTPNYDLRNAGWKPADEQTGDLLKLFYDDRGGWLGQEYEIIFSQNKVIEVKKATK
jgi:hypothetical protein